MSSTTELSSEQIFHVLKNGEADSRGPYTTEELEDLLSHDEIEATDYVFYEGLKDWILISDAFEFKKGPLDFAEDGQDQEVVAVSFSAINDRAETDEEIVYIAVQQLEPGDRISEILQSMPQAVVLTNQRISVISPKLIGDVEIEDYPFGDIELVTSQVNRRHGGSNLKIELGSNRSVDIESIPDVQLFRFIEIAEETFQNREI